MARLGELLVATGLVEADKVEQALRAQVVWGGRLGTNLVELGYIDLDELSRALGRHHGLPAAQARHFDKADPKLQHQLPIDLADRYSFVPILRLADHKVAGAAMDPLGIQPLSEIADALTCAVEDLIVSVAAEQRMRYQLERVYGIARTVRYLRSRGPRFPAFPAFGDFSGELDSEVDLPATAVSDGDTVAIPIEWDEPPHVSQDASIATQRASTDELEAMIDQAASVASPPPPDSAGAERRRYVPTLADADAPSRPALEPQTLGRIAIRKVAVSVAPAGARSAANAPARTLAEAARAIRRATNREHVAELVMEAVEQFAPNCHCAVLMVVRGAAATGWRAFCREGALSPDVAVPLDKPGLVPTAVTQVQTARAKADQQSAIDRKLLAALNSLESELAAVPIAVSGNALGVLAVAIDPDAAIPNIDTIATSAGIALGRLMRDAAR